MFSDMHIVFFILLATTAAFAIPKFRSDLVALCSLLALFLAGVITVPEALAGFSSSVVIMLAVLFIVGEGISQSGIAGKVGGLLVKLTGNSEFKMLMFVKLLVAGMGCFISNTGTVAILMPVVVSLSTRMKIHPGQLLMPLAFGASMGGALTLIGTAPNLLASEALQTAGFDGLNFFDFTPVGLIILVTGILYMWFIGRRMLRKPFEEKLHIADSINVSEMLRNYGIDANLKYIEIPEGHELIGKSLKELDWASTYGVTVLKVCRDTGNRIIAREQIVPEPGYVIGVGDVMLLHDSCKCDFNHVFSDILCLRVREEHEVNGLSVEGGNIAEVILTPNSTLDGHTLKSLQFRGKYGLTVLALRCVNKKAKDLDMDTVLHYGDSILVYGDWNSINILSDEKSDVVVLGDEKKEPDKLDLKKVLLAGGILLGMIVMLVIDIIPAVMTVIIAGLLMVFAGCVSSMDRAYRSVNWKIVVLIACMLPMATALENTGGVRFIADGITASLGGAGPIVVMAGLYVVTSLFGVFISNTATAVLFLPVAILSASEMGVSPLPFVMAVTFAASMSFATPVSTPPNAMVMVAGKYKFVDYMKVGIPLQIIVGIIILAVLPLFFPL